MPLPAIGEASVIEQPREEAFDLPAPFHASQRPAVLCAPAVLAVGSNHLDAVRRHQVLIEPITVVATVADQSERKVWEESRVKGRRDKVGSYGEALAT